MGVATKVVKNIDDVIVKVADDFEKGKILVEEAQAKLTKTAHQYANKDTVFNAPDDAFNLFSQDKTTQSLDFAKNRDVLFKNEGINTTSEVVFMSPDQYIAKAAKGFNDRAKLKTRDLINKETPIKNLPQTKEDMLIWRKQALDIVREDTGLTKRQFFDQEVAAGGLDTPYLNYFKGGGIEYFGQEGLHRALYAQEKGITKIPVVITREVPKANPKLPIIAGLSMEEMARLTPEEQAEYKEAISMMEPQLTDLTSEEKARLAPEEVTEFAVANAQERQEIEQSKGLNSSERIDVADAHKQNREERLGFLASQIKAGDEFKEGLAQFAKGETVGELAGGLGKAGFSLFTALEGVIDRVIGEPTREIVKFNNQLSDEWAGDNGIEAHLIEATGMNPEELTVAIQADPEFAGQLAEEAAWFIAPGTIINKFRKISPGLKAVQKAQKLGTVVKAKDTARKVADKTPKAPIVRLEKTAKDEILKDISTGNKEVVKKVQKAIDDGVPVDELEDVVRNGIQGEVSKVGKASRPAFSRAIKPMEDAVNKALRDAKGATDAELRRVGSPLTSDDFGKIVGGARAALQGNKKDSQRIFGQVADAIGAGEIAADDVARIMKQRGWTPEEFAQEFKEYASTLGRDLGRLGKLQRELGQIFKDNPEMLKAFGAKPATFGDNVMGWWRKIENFRRANMVGQIATAMRNEWSQAARISISTMDEVLQGLSTGIIKRDPGLAWREVKNGLNSFHALRSRLSKGKRKKLEELLDAEHGVVQKSRLLSQPVHEVVLGKYTKVVNALNRAQEFFYRRLAFESRLRTNLARRGQSFETINPRDLDLGDMKDAVDYALEMTFAATPKGRNVRQFIDSWTKFGGTLIQPFPRFVLGNSLPFLFEHSPLGLIKMFSPKTMKALASGDPKQFVKSASRAAIGSTMLYSAMELRQSKHAGEKWYEIKVPDTGKIPFTDKDIPFKGKTIDMRPFAPFSSYLFFADVLNNPQKYERRSFAANLLEATVGLSRVSGTGLAIADVIRAKDIKGQAKAFEELISRYIASFTTPFRSIKDINAQIDPEEAVRRDANVKEDFLAPLKNNLPYYSQTLPKKRSLLRSGDIVEEEPLGKQLTGLSSRTKNVLEKEVDRIGLPFSAFSFRTGIPAVDRRLAEIGAPVVEEVVPEIIKSDNYKNLDQPTQRFVLNELFKEVKEAARAMLAQTDPEMAIAAQLEGQSSIIKEVMDVRGFDIDETVEKMLKGGRN